MDKEERDNWQIIKDKMEESGNMDNPFYKRACVICSGGADPLDLPHLEIEE